MRSHPKATRRQDTHSVLCGWKTQDNDDPGIEQWRRRCRSERKLLGNNGAPSTCGTYLHVEEVRCNLLTKASAGQHSGLAKPPSAPRSSDHSNVRLSDDNDLPAVAQHTPSDLAAKEDRCHLPPSTSEESADLVNVRSSNGLSPVAHQVFPDLQRTKRLLNLSHRTSPPEQGPKPEDFNPSLSRPPLSLEALGLTSLVKEDSFRGGHRDMEALKVTAGQLMRASQVIKMRSQACMSVAMAFNLATLPGLNEAPVGSRQAEDLPNRRNASLPLAPTPALQHQPHQGEKSTLQTRQKNPPHLRDISSVGSGHERGPHVHQEKATPGGDHRGRLKYSSRCDGGGGSSGPAGGPSGEKTAEALSCALPSSPWRDARAASRCKERAGGGGDGGGCAGGQSQQAAKGRPLAMPLELPPALQWQTTGSLVHLQRMI